MASNKIQFRSIHELKDSSLNAKLAQKEFQEEIPVDEFLGNDDKMNNSKASRRDFLKLLGFSTAAVTLAACEAPVLKTIPYVVKPHNIIPGVPNYYASTFYDGYDFASVLVKTREGRPIKIDGNPLAGALGGTNARVQAGLLSLYDNDKIKKPTLNGQEESFDKIDAFVQKELDNAKVANKRIVVLSHSFASPTFKKLFSEFKEKYPTAEYVVYDALPYTSALDAAQEVFGRRNLPVYDLSETELVVSFQADFLNDYNGGSLESSYAKARKPRKNMLRHIQVESNMSLTGANADTRVRLKPTEVNRLLVEVYKGLSGNTSDKVAQKLVSELKEKGNKAVIFADGTKGAYVLAHLINQKLGSVAFTGKANFLKEYSEERFNEFKSWLQSGEVGVLISNDVNPIYSHQSGAELEKLIKKVPCHVAVIQKKDQMYKVAKVAIPSAHWLESWGDIMPETGVYSLIQPTIQKVFQSRQIEESLLVWINGKGASNNDYYAYLKANAVNLLNGISFNKALYNGFNEINSDSKLVYSGGNSEAAIDDINKLKATEIELMLYTSIALGDGTQANNPWLQEMPDPITRISWDNYLTVSPKDAEKLGLKNELNGRMQLDGTKVNVKLNNTTVLKDVPVFIQPGQADGCFGLALGYGKIGSGKVAETGINAYPLYDGKSFAVSNISIEKSDSDMHEFAGMQLQNTLMGRYEIAKEVSLETFLNVPFDDPKKGWNKPLEYHTLNGAAPANKITLWDSFDDTDGPHFNLSVDLNACTGCGACIIACQVENNTPVVGKDEVRMSRDMYWLRIDRYYSTDVPKQYDKNGDSRLSQEENVEAGLNVPDMYGSVYKGKESGILNHPAENPDVIFQPVMCQHCNNAPCETVCPVAATSHGKQGQNQMAYNRCVGTRYCANNCPYKVRRFNWFTYNLNDKFDYNMNNDLGRMVLNPDVVVRTRGVMEKCSLCIQSTQAAILEAKKEGRRVTDQEFNDACACSTACSSGAMRFGDMNDQSSKVRELFKDERRYFLLEEIGTKPNVFYHTKVRNRKESERNI